MLGSVQPVAVRVCNTQTPPCSSERGGAGLFMFVYHKRTGFVLQLRCPRSTLLTQIEGDEPATVENKVSPVDVDNACFTVYGDFFSSLSLLSFTVSCIAP